MAASEVIRLISELLDEFGGAVAIIFGLSGWIGLVLAKRIAQKENGVILEKLENLKTEHSYEKISYEKNLELLLDYYDSYHNHYRRCQKTAYVDILRRPGIGDTDVKKQFFDEIDEYVKQWKAKEGKIRLLLPNQLLNLHTNSIGAFNEFRDLVKNYNPKSNESRNKLHDKFKEIDSLKQQMESELRQYLRTEKMLK